MQPSRTLAPRMRRMVVRYYKDGAAHREHTTYLAPGVAISGRLFHLQCLDHSHVDAARAQHREISVECALRRRNRLIRCQHHDPV